MNIRKIFEKRIRGWFPKEPYSISIGVKEDSKTKPQSLVIPLGYDLSATFVAGLTTVFYAILGSLLIISFFSLEKNITFTFPSRLDNCGINSWRNFRHNRNKKPTETTFKRSPA